MVSRRCAGSGLRVAKLSPPQIAAKRSLEPELRQQQARQALQLVGADGEDPARGGEAVEQLDAAPDRAASRRRYSPRNERGNPDACASSLASSTAARWRCSAYSMRWRAPWPMPSRRVGVVVGSEAVARQDRPAACARRSGALSTSVPSRSKTRRGASHHRRLSRPPALGKQRRARPLGAPRAHAKARADETSGRDWNVGGSEAARRRSRARSCRKTACGSASAPARRRRISSRCSGGASPTGLDVVGVPTSETTARLARDGRHSADHARRDAGARPRRRRRRRDRPGPRADQGRRRGAAAREDRRQRLGAHDRHRRCRQAGRRARRLSAADRGRRRSA